MKYIIISFIAVILFSNNIFASENLSGFHGGESDEFNLESFGGDGISFYSVVVWDNNKNFKNDDSKLGDFYFDGVVNWDNNERLFVDGDSNLGDFHFDGVVDISNFENNENIKQEIEIIEDVVEIVENNSGNNNHSSGGFSGGSSGNSNNNSSNDNSDSNNKNTENNEEISDKKTEVVFENSDFEKNSIENNLENNNLNKDSIFINNEEKESKYEKTSNLEETKKILTENNKEEKNTFSKEEGKKQIVKNLEYVEYEEFHSSAYKIDKKIIDYLKPVCSVLLIFLIIIFFISHTFFCKKNGINFIIRKIKK